MATINSDNYPLSISIKKDAEADISLIKEYFFNNESAYFRNRILYFYKTLAQKLEGVSKEDAPNVLSDYFKNIYTEKKTQIEKIIDNSQILLEEKSKECLKQLVQIMDYEIERDEEFVGIATLLPYSPFNRPIFNFSIAGILFLGRENKILEIAIHEISHFLFFDIMQKIGLPILKLRENPINKGLEHLYKETLTGVILSEPKLENLLQLKNYLGNSETHNLYIKEAGKDAKLLRKYLQEKLKEYKEGGLGFNNFINDTFRKFLPVADQFDKKKSFWDKNERELKEESSALLEEYRKPITI